MVKRERFPYGKMLLSVVLLSTCTLFSAAKAEEATTDADAENAVLVAAPNLVVGNMAVKTQTVERVIRTLIANALKGSVVGNDLHFVTPGIQETLPIKAKSGDFQEILDILHIGSTIPVTMSSIVAHATLPENGLTISVTNVSGDRFMVDAKWQINRIAAQSKSLNLLLQKGLFQQACNISSTPIQIGLAPRSNPITVDLTLVTQLTPAGLLVQLKDLVTNISSHSNGPTFYATLGPLSACGSPFALDMTFANGKTLHADEKTIRGEFQEIEPNLIANIQGKFEGIIQEDFLKIAKTVASKSPLKYSVDVGSQLQSMKKTATTDIVNSLLGDLRVDLTATSIQSASRGTLFSVEAGAKVCFAQNCITPSLTAPATDPADVVRMTNNSDGGVVINEAFLQNVIDSPQVQQRILNFYQKDPAAGVSLTRDGVKVHVDPIRKAIVVVANLALDIKKTDACGWLSKEMNILGDAIESRFGSGKLVIIPLEIAFHPAGLQMGKDGKMNLILTSTLPFIDAHNVLNTYHYPSNVADMIVKPIDIRAKVIAAIKDLMQGTTKPCGAAPAPKALVGKTISIPLDQIIKVDSFGVQLKNVAITPNRGVLITADMKN